MNRDKLFFRASLLLRGQENRSSSASFIIEVYADEALSERI